jgi:hypothetical protein
LWWIDNGRMSMNCGAKPQKAQQVFNGIDHAVAKRLKNLLIFDALDWCADPYCFHIQRPAHVGQGEFACFRYRTFDARSVNLLQECSARFNFRRNQETDEGIANLAEGRVVTEIMMKKSHCVGHVFSDDCHRSNSQKKTNLHGRSSVRNSLQRFFQEVVTFPASSASQ